jgi:parallel beta-helix repeat protein
LAGVLPFAAMSAGAATTRYVSPSGTDTANVTCDSVHPCKTVQHAVDVATPGDTIQIAAGTYVEQVQIGKSIRVVGAGTDKTVIVGPNVKAFDSFGKTYIVEVNASASVSISQLTVKGPSGPGGGLNCAPNPLSLDMGVAVVSNATLNLSSAAVRDIYDIDLAGVENSGCQRGDAISVGKPGGPVTPTVGHAVIRGVLVDRYQKNGIASRTAGTTLDVSVSLVRNQPSTVIASNGIEVLSGARGSLYLNGVVGNQCNHPTACGPDPFDPVKTQASGILLFSSNPNTFVSGNYVSSNDLAIYTDDGVSVSHNQASDNRSAGIFVDTDATNGHVTGNTTDRNGFYGIAIGSGNAGGNFFSENSAFGNVKYDLYQSPGNGPNVNSNNHCGTAFPDKTYWDCRDNSGGGD